jgi:hypothetical protein
MIRLDHNPTPCNDLAGLSTDLIDWKAYAIVLVREVGRVETDGHTNEWWTRFPVNRTQDPKGQDRHEPPENSH